MEASTRDCELIRQMDLWIFPRRTEHGWRGGANVEELESQFNRPYCISRGTWSHKPKTWERVGFRAPSDTYLEVRKEGLPMKSREMLLRNFDKSPGSEWPCPEPGGPQKITSRESELLWHKEEGEKWKRSEEAFSIHGKSISSRRLS